MLVRIDADGIRDAESFHSLFAATFGFPEWYGRNMDAWIDGMSDLDDPESGMTAVHLERGQTLLLAVDHASRFRARCPDLFAALLESAAFVNGRRLDVGQAALIVLATDG